jgi:hypothetical protein
MGCDIFPRVCHLAYLMTYSRHSQTRKATRKPDQIAGEFTRGDVGSVG